MQSYLMWEIKNTAQEATTFKRPSNHRHFQVRWRFACPCGCLGSLAVSQKTRMAQYPYLIYPDLTVSQVAAHEGALRFLLYAVPAGMALLLPSLWLLFRVFKGEPAAVDGPGSGTA